MKTKHSIKQILALWTSTLAFTACFAVWTIFSIIGIKIKQEFGLSDTQFSILLGTPILTGSLTRLFFGIWADQYGGRRILIPIMTVSALATYLLIYAHSYKMMLLTALILGVAGGSFVVGITYVSKWFAAKEQGTVLGIYGMGNVGAAVTKLTAPFVMVAYGWRTVAEWWAAALLLIGILFGLLTRDEPEIANQKNQGKKIKTLASALEPLKKIQVWRFSMYYFFVFGAFVALALWLPHYYIGLYQMDVRTAGVLAASFSIAGSTFRALGGYLSDRLGARKLMYLTFIVTLICCFILSYPATDFMIHGIRGDIKLSLGLNVVGFTGIVFLLGLFMSFGKAAVYKHIPAYYPDNVGSVAGIVGLIGGLGGFILPILFGVMNDFLNIWTSCFMLLFLLAFGSLIWMHSAVIQMERINYPELKGPKDLPELERFQKGEKK